MKRALVLDHELNGHCRHVRMADAADLCSGDECAQTGGSSDVRLFLIAFCAGFLFFSALIA